MRRNKCLFYILSALMMNMLILIYFVILQHRDLTTYSQSNGVIKRSKKTYNHSLTVIIREYEEFENNLDETIENLLMISDNIEVLVIGDKLPYPPIKNKSSRIKIVSLVSNLQISLIDSRPENSITSDFILFLPDSTTISNFSDIKQAIQDLLSTNLYNSLALSVSNSQLFCQNLVFDIKKWTLIYSGSESKINCDIVMGNHGLLTRTKTILELPDPFMKPVYLSYYIQNSVSHAKVHIYNKVILQSLRELFPQPHARWKHKKYEELRRKQMFKTLGVKLVKHSDKKQEWFGCNKETLRCFDTVINDMPDYLYQDKWTPPCCHKALKETVHHVFKILSNCGARFWLEGGSLLGAARNGDIIPWDYDVDIGIYRDDLTKCDQFKIDSLNDNNGFLWEKAIEGEFYRVQYSGTNRLHVDIFPFYSRNGTMTKNTWYKTHRQDTEFPERFLKPITSIKFVGLDAPAPNNVREFLEFKFGKGVIENPKYPNSHVADKT